MIACLWLAASAEAASFGTAGAELWRTEGSARSAGLAGAAGALADDPTLVGSNPATAAWLSRTDLQLSHHASLASISAQLLSVASPRAARAGAWFAQAAFRSTEISNGSQLGAPSEGTVFGADLHASWGMAVVLAHREEDGAVRTLGLASRPWARGVAVGAQAKFLYSRLTGVTAVDRYRYVAYGVDFGIQWKTPIRRLTAGFSVRNLGPDVRRVSLAGNSAGAAAAPPLALHADAAVLVYDGPVARTTVTGQARAIWGSGLAASLAGEYQYMGFLTLRAGWNLDSFRGAASGPAAGLGVRVGKGKTQMRLDYAWRPMWVPYLVHTHLFAIGLRR